jgi:hypothetical protein
VTLTGHDTIRARTAQAQLEAIRSRLIGQAERDLAKAELYQNSKRQGERNSAPIVARRGLDAINAVALLDTVIYPPTTPRRAYPPATPRQANQAWS